MTHAHNPSAIAGPQPRAPWRAEWPLPLVLATGGLFQVLQGPWLGDLTDPLWFGLVFVWLFAAILGAAMRVIFHAECLAVLLGEPYGTLILTLAVTTIEVLMIATAMLHGDNNPTLARDVMFSVLMIVLNGLVGLSLLLGALRYNEQSYNLQGAHAYLSVIIPLAALILVMPDVTVSTLEATFSPFQAAFVIVTSLGLYTTFLLIQTHRHRTYFIDESADAGGDAHPDRPPAGPYLHTALLLLYLGAAILLAEDLAIPIDIGIEQLGLPAALAGFVIATLTLAPEGIATLRAALRNRLQRAMNIALGSVLATIGLTGPAVLAISLANHHPLTLGLPNAGVTILALTFGLAILTFSTNRTNVLQGAVHLILFLAFLMLIFAP
jgi:Ca2+:H+ antiporter